MAGGGRAGKRRLDEVLVARGLAENRSRAQSLIMAGLVFSVDRRLEKAGQQVAGDVPLEVRGREHPWVGRGGMKLAHAFECFEITANGRVAIDVGASTGGFTDVLLAKGAVRVHAVDVGHGQLAWKLRSDERVVVRERTNARHLTREMIGEAVDIVVCDASFIGLRTVLPAALALTRPGAWAVALIKPQFEVGRDSVGKGGVVRDPALHEEVQTTIRDWFNARPGWRVAGLTASPILGSEGNREFLIHARRDDE